MKNEKQPGRLNKVLATAAGLALAAAGTGMAVNANPTRGAEGVTTFASPSPEAGAATVAEEGFTLQSGQFMKVLPGDIISADGSMSDTLDGPIRPLYDTDLNKDPNITDTADTALFINVVEPGIFWADNGGYVKRGLTGQQRETYLYLQRNSKVNGGFKYADVVDWTGYDTTVDQGQIVHDSENPLGNQGETVSRTPEITDPGQIIEYVGANPNLDPTVAQKLLDTLIENGFDVNAPENQDTLQTLLACICQCEPGEMPKATPGPTPTPKPREVCDPQDDHIMKQGETYRVPARYDDVIVQADAIIKIKDGRRVRVIRTYDDLGPTRSVNVIRHIGDAVVTVQTPVGGGDVQQFNDCATDAVVTEWYQNDLKADSRRLDRNSIKIDLNN
ncbi:MAG: hypothetical protein COU25_01535 [Candidatus Levybacteria bacterium CG10_big_fil_rev_8_21_14_0_10_35_13]|nr:MAG: hypothetical protein COU25_01535 [Candidatus Levybacteria bacterium CG10_big_fil_rev_8_21_14_0_10_35_13]